MTKRAMMILCLLVANMAVAQPPESSGQATCNQIDKEGRYHVAWNLSASPRTYYWVQRLIVDGQAWRSLWKPVTAPYATSETAVDGGSLYRAYACNDIAGTQGGVECQVDRSEARRIAAVAGTVGAQRLAIAEGIFALRITLAVAGQRAVDGAAEENLGRACRTERLAHLNRHCIAAREREIPAIAAPHAKGGSGG